jgi:aldehyde:ferredoxin oxidoreductase
VAITRVLRVNLTEKQIKAEQLDDETSRKYLGGLGMGARILYSEVPPGVDWSSPENRLVLSAGPLDGTLLAGAGSFCVVTKGSLTNGATSSQANGYFGAFLRLSGFDAVVIEGTSRDWAYLHIHDGTAELRKASHLVGKDTCETESSIKRECGGDESKLSVYSIGPAGEHLARFSSIVGDGGHVAAHNGVGAVMGSKKLKAFAASKGNEPIEVRDNDSLRSLNKKMLERAKTETREWEEGTSFLLAEHIKRGVVPVKNLTTNVFPDYERLTGKYYRTHFELKRHPCWRCPLKHCHIITVTEGPYRGYVADEPEYECFAGWGPLIGQSDPGAAIMLSDVTDRLGFDNNEASWLMAFVMECYERGIITKSDTDGLEMNWGNVESARAMLINIAYRRGIGNILAEGVMRAAQAIGGEAPNVGVYVMKGQAPRGHDHRARWIEMLDTATSDCGTIAVGPQAVRDHFSPEAVVDTLVGKRIRTFVDSLVICAFPSATMLGSKIDYLVNMLGSITGWDYTEDEAMTTGRRVDNLLRAFNIRHGVGPELERPSPRYGSAQTDGPVKAESIMPHWDFMTDAYNKRMGWDGTTGRPLPETLWTLGLEDVARDLWK